MREVEIAMLGTGGAGGSVRIAGRVITSDGSDGGVLRDQSGEVCFHLEADSQAMPGELPRRGDIISLFGSIDEEGIFQAAECDLLVRPSKEPFEDAEGLRLASPALRQAVVARSRLLATVRGYFAEESFLEVETGLLVDEPSQEPTLSPLPVGGKRWLVTSPELRMKRLLAAGYERIFEISHVFRDGPGERSPWHHPEFTLLEWYRSFEGTDAIIRDLETLLPLCARQVSGESSARRGEASVSLDGPYEILTVTEAFSRHAGLNLESMLNGDDDAFCAEARAAGIQVDVGESAESVFFRVLLDRVESHLGQERPTILTGYPARMAALARLDPADERVALRFECYVLGVELANAFCELTDPVEQSERIHREREEKAADGRDPGPFPQKFLRALELGMQPSSGIALGVDRLLMLVLGHQEIDSVLLFPEDT